MRSGGRPERTPGGSYCPSPPGDFEPISAPISRLVRQMARHRELERMADELLAEEVERER